MFIKLNRLIIRPAALSAVVLALLFAAGCAEEASVKTQTGQPAQNTTAVEHSPALREITLSVPGMDCPVCPITVRRALGNVDGVTEADADLKTREARVRFDPDRTDIDTLITAVRNSGFSAIVKEQRHE